MHVPFLDLRRQHQELAPELQSVFQATLARGVYILGEEVAAFEREWAAACGGVACAGVANGTDALVLALLASGVIEPGRGDEVITSPLSAAYTALAIRQAGAVPVFADISPHTYTLDPAAVVKAITPRTKALLPVHLYGQMAAMPELCSIARQHGLVVIEDCAQAHGASLAGTKAGAYGDAAAFSFYPTKNLGALGDGGAVVARDAAWIERVRRLRQGGHPQALQGTEVGMNSRLDELQAAVLRVKLRQLDRWTARRREIAASYCGHFSGLSDLVLPSSSKEGEVFHLFVVRHPRREDLRAHLAAQGVETLVHYPYLLHQQPLFRPTRGPQMPVAESVAPQIFSLPLNPHLFQTEIETVIQAVLSFFGA
jgi:dTDP-4-amino-4,6-dideoxygalactose transaminase